MSSLSSMPLSTPPARRALAKRYPLPFVRDAMLRCIERRGARWTFFDAREVPRISARQKHACFTPPFDPSAHEQWLDVPLHALARKLAPLGFVRIHRSELINLRFLRAVVRPRRPARAGLVVELSDGQHVQVSRRYTAQLRRALEQMVASPPGA